MKSKRCRRRMRPLRGVADGRSGGGATGEFGDRLFEHGPVILFRWLPEPGWPVAFVSPGVVALGYSADDFLSGGLMFAEIVHPEDAARVAEEVRSHTASGAAQFTQEYRILAPDGRVVWLFDRTLVERDAGGQVTAYVGYVVDVSDLRGAQAKARELERLQGVVLDNLPGVDVEYLDTDLRLRWASRSFLKNFGCTPESAIGRKCHEVVQHSDQPCSWCTATRALRTGLPQSGEARSPDGRSWWLASTPVRDASGQMEGVVHVATDVTQKAATETALRESEERLRLLVDNMPVLIHAHDAQGRYIFWNKEAERVLGWSAALIVDSDEAQRLLYPDDAYRTGVVDVVHAGGDYQGTETVMRCADGGQKVISWSNISGRLPIPGWATWEVGVDVTARRAAEERRADVEHILRHDLKRPLIQAVEVVELLRALGGVRPDVAEHFDSLDLNARRSLRMIDGYARLQGLESGRAKLSLQSVDLEGLVRTVLREFAQSAASRGVRLVMAEDGGQSVPHVQGDPPLLWSLLANLVGNAMEATDPEGEVRVSLAREDGCARIDVWNARPVPEELRPVFFEKFTTTGKCDGLGLGTFSARLIARAHGGEVEMRSDEASGTLLTVRLPFQP